MTNYSAPSTAYAPSHGGYPSTTAPAAQGGAAGAVPLPAPFTGDRSLDDCWTCRGRGEVAVPGTYGATISPEVLETRICRDCQGSGVAA